MILLVEEKVGCQFNKKDSKKLVILIASQGPYLQKLKFMAVPKHLELGWNWTSEHSKSKLVVKSYHWLKFMDM